MKIPRGHPDDFQEDSKETSRGILGRLQGGPQWAHQGPNQETRVGPVEAFLLPLHNFLFI